jgi:CheY-like chemotaxis protein
MEAVGQLAGGVAHDFNNLLTVINGYALLLLRELAPTHPGAEMAAEVLAAGKRAEDLIRRLLAFGRRQVLQPRELDLNELIANLTKMLHRLIGEDVRITTALSPSLGRVIADPAQLEQVIINLCVNARDVMPAGGRLTIATAPVKVVADSPLAQKQFPLGRYARISVTDTGCGMSEAVLEKIFEPFFTTKPVGRGTGLGLSTAFGIVTQSGGRIEVASTVGEGTTFDVYLPVVTGGSGVVAAASERVGPAVGGHETVLLVEDESVVRQFTATVLRNAGYTVLEAEGAAEATRTHAAHAGAVRLLLTDVVMPHESGCTLAERLRRASPGLRVLFMSGFADDRTVGHGLQKTEAKFVQKPFDADELLRAVRRVLDLPDAT